MSSANQISNGYIYKKKKSSLSLPLCLSLQSHKHKSSRLIFILFIFYKINVTMSKLLALDKTWIKDLSHLINNSHKCFTAEPLDKWFNITFCKQKIRIAARIFYLSVYGNFDIFSTSSFFYFYFSVKICV